MAATGVVETNERVVKVKEPTLRYDGRLNSQLPQDSHHHRDHNVHVSPGPPSILINDNLHRSYANVVGAGYAAYLLGPPKPSLTRIC